jgi:DNA-binding NarL/FixJ family response regulator
MKGQPGTGRIRLVTVDDHPTIREGIRTVLAGSEIDVVGEAADGRNAVALCRQQQPDIALLDMYLPHVNGVEIVKQLSGELPALQVVIYSMSEAPWLVQESLAAGAKGYIFKSSPPEQLRRALLQVAGGRVYVDRALAERQGKPGQLSEPVLPPASLLSKRELEVLRLFARGVTGKEAAQALELSPRTLETYKARAMYKLQLRSRTDLMRFAIHSGWLG